MTLVRVTTAAEAAARDADTIAAGTPVRLLMQRAGERAAAAIARAHPDLLRTPVTVYTGPGNNGGDGWVVARTLAGMGARVFVQEAGEAKSEEARAERALALRAITRGEHPESRLIVDALLGIGSHGAPRGEIAACIERIARARATGAVVAALDVPSGLDADSGDAVGAVTADLTLTFGTLKRGLTVARAAAGRILVLDIGLAEPPARECSPALVDAAWVRAHIPPIRADAHKGTRRKIAIVGGQLGMAGASMLAARAAMRSGAGMVRLVVARENLPVVQSAVPEATAQPWPESVEEMESAVAGWPDVVVIGPGLGASLATRALVERVLRGFRGPVVLDADALNVFAGEAEHLGALIGDRAALITPHAAEFARLLGVSVEDVLARRFEIGAELAARARCTVLLKGVPTVITNPRGDRYVSAAGTPVLAAAGSGDLLSGIAGTLLAQMDDPLTAGACAAWTHGHAGEIAGGGRVRGVVLADVERALGQLWSEPLTALEPPVLAELPAVGDR
jgi:ADP-dependent NAD(P)H-hydrate dehydratase / NAD(P)H-hydrate epimerase